MSGRRTLETTVPGEILVIGEARTTGTGGAMRALRGAVALSPPLGGGASLTSLHEQSHACRLGVVEDGAGAELTVGVVAPAASTAVLLQSATVVGAECDLDDGWHVDALHAACGGAHDVADADLAGVVRAPAPERLLRAEGARVTVPRGDEGTAEMRGGLRVGERARGAELIGPVGSPAQDRAVERLRRLDDRAAVRAAHGDRVRRWYLRHGERRHARCNVARADLVVSIVAPATHLATREARAGVAAAGLHLCDIRETRNDDGRVARVTGVLVAKLTPQV